MVKTPFVAQCDDKNVLFLGADADEEPSIDRTIAQEQLFSILLSSSESMHKLDIWLLDLP